MESSALRSSRPALSASVNKTLSNTFFTVGAMMALTGVASVFTMGMQLSLWAYLGCFIASIALIFATHAFRNSGFGLVLLAGFSALQGVTLGPLLTHYLAMPNGASLVASAAGMTALATFGCAAYAITTRRDFSRWRGFLFAGLVVLILASLVGLFVNLPALHLTLSVVSAVLFTGWLLYDVGSIVNGQETNYITASLGIYLDVLNIFISLLRIFGFLPGGDD